MADLKISQLPVFTSAVPATDAFAVVSGGTTKQITTNQILGSSGVATLASAAITGAATVGTTLGVTGTSTLASANVSGLLGVGTVSPDASFKATLSGLYGLRVQSADTNNSAINFGSDTAAGYSFIDTTKTGSGSFLPLRLSTSDTERLRIETAGDVKINTGNVVMGTSGKGIDFGVTTPDGTGTVTSELLDDYEEGTWTPAYSPTTGAFTTLPTVGSGKYRKIGDTVFFSIAIKTAGTVVLGAASGDIQITGFPFTCSAAGGNGTSSLFQQFNLAVSSAHLGISITGSTTIATITKNLSNGSVTYVQANELSTATGNFENLIYAFGMYNV